MLGEPDEVGPELIQPPDLFDDLGVEIRVFHSGVRRIAKVVTDTDSKIRDS
jgi:hypothetical protein